MATVTEKKLAYLQGTKEAIKSALIEKGQAVSDTDTFRSYADKVAAIKTGAGGGTDVTIFPNVEIALDFRGGDMLIDAGEGYAVRTATIFKPETLKPENIKAGVTIAGIEGTHEGGGGGNYVDFGVVTDTISWMLHTDGTLFIKGSGDMVWYNSVSDRPWHEYASDIKSVVVNDGITHLGAYAFEDCTNLTSVNLPNGMTSLGQRTFANCTSLASMVIPANTGSSCFNGCTGLISVIVLDSVTDIGSSCFQGCTSLASVNIPDSISFISNQSFMNCTSLTSITIPTAVTKIFSNVFFGCTSLASITIPDSVTQIYGNAFYGCTGLENIVIGSGVTKIESNAFAGTYSGTADTTRVTFKNPSGWWYTSSSTATSGTKISESLLADPVSANKCLCNDYVKQYLRRT